ncbi:putative polyprenyl synthetase [Microbacterium sorbitolivorans]|nr:polyprenyl synthetase family protein [Microbacterium sorbitolivorans]GGF33870.1 putative polyprenyl synthetase [Microbacterium sorbitolivorans]
MSTLQDIITDISERLEKFLQDRRDEVARDAALDASDPVVELMLEHAAATLAGGKRLRARFAFWGWRAAGAASSPESVIALGAALEIFQAAALVHDDIVDNSDTRRGAPSAWRALEAAHRERGWSGSAEEFGRTGGILLGDLLLGWSDDLFEEALEALSPGAARSARAQYARMRRDVTLGQFLDVAGEAAWPATPDELHADRAQRVAVLKSARYSVQQPLLLGARIAGAGAGVLDSLAAIGHPLGLAFQLRDDVLGAFGNPELTGKPAGDDLVEGKRTLLIAYAREELDPAERAALDARLGGALSDDEIARMQELLRGTGALDRVENEIAAYAQQARDAISAAGFDEATVAELQELVTATTVRVF